MLQVSDLGKVGAWAEKLWDECMSAARLHHLLIGFRFRGGLKPPSRPSHFWALGSYEVSQSVGSLLPVILIMNIWYDSCIIIIIIIIIIGLGTLLGLSCNSIPECGLVIQSSKMSGLGYDTLISCNTSISCEKHGPNPHSRQFYLAHASFLWCLCWTHYNCTTSLWAYLSIT